MLKLFWVQQHLKHVLQLLSRDDPTLTLREVHRRLELCHQHLQDLQKQPRPAQLRHWDRWSVLLFYFRKEEVTRQVLSAVGHLQGKVTPEDLRQAHQCLLTLHFRMVDVSDRSSG